jgi:hypothetical protein
MKQRLWHASDREDIEVFVPRLPQPATDDSERAFVWAIVENRLPNYLVPRECPRVCFWRGAPTTDEDCAAFLGTSRHVVAVEDRWMPMLQSSSIWLYELPSEPFACTDENADYFTSQASVRPLAKFQVKYLQHALAARGVELRTTSRLRALAESVADSTLAFSIIRLRNAATIPDAA